MNQKTRALALVPGAENGVGPELLLASLSHHDFSEHTFYWCGDKKSLQDAALARDIPLSFTDSLEALLDNGTKLSYVPPLLATNLSERQALFLKNSIELAAAKKIDAIVTAPIEKAALGFLPGGPWPGQTEYFAHHLSGKYPAFMAFLGAPFIMSLLTTHVPLRKVSSLISKEKLLAHLHALAVQCAKILKKPDAEVRIAVLGLNPHAGEHGLLGHEELNELIPAISAAQNEGLMVNGPYAADGYFGFLKNQPPVDAIVAMYHDQGLIPYKLLADSAAVNATLGLKIPRTSPAHGTAVELRGTKKACFLSTIKAIEVALMLTR